ncbi:ATP-binding protein [Brevundimonas sp. G8]|uniref:ATP-binding protein n=1 Tax=Brevundimonas sp. G8 TaxID=1350776 RepID=UPI0012F0AD8B|nr:ATP-binding protein [Brevundimonas sp. G8]VXB25038.1 Two-component system, OmpR family, sensor histidine kinase AdeS [Brevundimonas sp. G8]
MRAARALGPRIAVRMALVTLAVLGLSAAGAFALYGWVFENYPDAVASPQAWHPQPVDYVALASAAVLALIGAAFAGLQLARRIVLPLASLSGAARAIADGDLSARAAAGDRSMSETADLVDDFNLMAQRLEALAADMTTWNASIAHELRTPVTIVKGRLQAAADGVLPLDREMILTLLKPVDALGRLIEDLRVVSLADSGRLQLRLTPQDLGKRLEDVRALVGAEAEAEGYPITWTTPSTPVVCDGDRIQQAVLALLENVRRHADPGPVAVSVTVDDRFAIITVEDSGPGLPDPMTQSVFTAFKHGSDDTGGTGLGLAVVRAIAEAHGGSAYYGAAIGRGSVVEIRLPGNLHD